MEDVQVVRAVVRKERGDQRVRDSFEDAVSEGEDEHAAEEAVVGQGFGRFTTVTRHSGERDDGREDVQQECGDDQFAVANLVADDAAEDDAEAEAGQPRATNHTKLGTGEAEFFAPVVKDTAADGKADTGGENRHEAGPQEAFGVGRDGLVRGRLVFAHSFAGLMFRYGNRLKGELRELHDRAAFHRGFV